MALTVGIVGVVLALLSLGWQVFAWRRERRFKVAVRIREEGVAIGRGRYPITVVATNEGGTTEWVEQISLKATYDRDLNHGITFNSPELVRNPGMTRELRPRNRFESEFNLLSKSIGGGELPVSIVAVARFSSGREVRSQAMRPDPERAAQAREPDPAAEVNAQMAALPSDWNDDYYPEGPFALCPDCRAEIPVDARVCRFCGYRIEDAPEQPRKAAPQVRAGHKRLKQSSPERNCRELGKDG